MSVGALPPSADLTDGADRDTPAAPLFVFIGVLTKPHGLKGEMRFESEPGFDWTVLEQVERVYLGDEKRAYGVKSVRVGPKTLLLGLEGTDDRDVAELLRDADVYLASADAPPLDEDEFYVEDLIGCAVVTDEGRNLGVLDDVLFTGANDVFVVIDADGKEILLPHIAQVVLDVNLETMVITVHLLEGLVDEPDASEGGDGG